MKFRFLDSGVPITIFHAKFLLILSSQSGDHSHSTLRAGHHVVSSHDVTLFPDQDRHPEEKNTNGASEFVWHKSATFIRVNHFIGSEFRSRLKLLLVLIYAIHSRLLCANPLDSSVLRKLESPSEISHPGRLRTFDGHIL
jgi:hypothetical protein